MRKAMLTHGVHTSGLMLRTKPSTVCAFRKWVRIQYWHPFCEWCHQSPLCPHLDELLESWGKLNQIEGNDPISPLAVIEGQNFLSKNDWGAIFPRANSKHACRLLYQSVLRGHTSSVAVRKWPMNPWTIITSCTDEILMHIIYVLIWFATAFIWFFGEWREYVCKTMR